jgi:3,4-dihydroxy 2-butanone 4-phosphate synthase/GTP cyclohydrolase II
LHESLHRIAEAGSGMLIYLRQEGRGIGLLDKLRAYNLQDEGYDTVEANLLLGHQADERDYTLAAHILRDWHIASVRLMTNNPAKVESLHALGVTVTDRVPLQAGITPDNADYLRTKAERMRHWLTL